MHVVRPGACGLRRAAPNVVIAVRLMAINVINLYNKKQYQNDSKNDNNNIGAMQINSTKWEINKTNKKKKSPYCVRLFSLLLLFAFGIFIFFLVFVGFLLLLCCCCLLGILSCSITDDREGRHVRAALAMCTHWPRHECEREREREGVRAP